MDKPREKGFIARKLREFKRKRAEERAFRKVIEAKAGAAARQERLKQEIRLAKESERIIARRRLAAFKKRQKGGRGAMAGLSSFAAGFNQNFQESFGGQMKKRRRRK